jgi:RNA polymerase sigma-70 factor, ECF subfamily
VDRVSTDEEARLVASMTSYQGGAIEGFADLYADLVDGLERFFSAAAGRDTAQDLVQETFLEIHRSRRTYRPPAPVRPWVFGLARNVLRRHRRAAWRRRERETAAARAIDPAAEGRHARPAVDGNDLREALQRLSATRREAWVLHHHHGWSFQEIAARLSIGVDAAKLRSSRATRALREWLGPAAGKDRRPPVRRHPNGEEGEPLD